MKALIILFVLTYALQPYMPANALALHPYNESFSFWQLFTYPLLHANLLHLALNCITLYSFAGELQQYIGKAKTLILFSAGCFIGGMLQANIPGVVTVGCSAGICAIMAALAVINPLLKVNFMFIPVGFPIAVLVIIISITSAVLMYAGILPQLAHLSHAFGFISGVVFAFIHQYIHKWQQQKKRQRNPL